MACASGSVLARCVASKPPCALPAMKPPPWIHTNTGFSSAAGTFFSPPFAVPLPFPLPARVPVPRWLLRLSWPPWPWSWVCVAAVAGASSLGMGSIARRHTERYLRQHGRGAKARMFTARKCSPMWVEGAQVTVGTAVP